MTFEIEQTQYVLLPVGEYPAQITTVEPDDGQFGPQVKFTFTILDGDYKDQTLLGWASAKFNNKTKLYDWTRAVFDRPIPYDYNFRSDDLVGQKVSLTVIVKRKDDGTEFNRIEAVRTYSSNEKSDNGSVPSSPFPGDTN